VNTIDRNQLFNVEKLLVEFLSKIPDCKIPTTTDYVFGKDIRDPKTGDRYPLDNWYLHFTIHPPFYSDLSDVRLRLDNILLDDIKQFQKYKMEESQTEYPQQSLIMHQLCDWTWLVGDDGKILRPIISMDGKSVTYKATIVKYAKILKKTDNNI
jgi:hypothetical protein